MKVIIAGSREIKDYPLLLEAIKQSGFEIDEVVSGGAAGVDKLGERYAKENGKKLTVFPADWEAYGKGAGPVRNGEMAFYVGSAGALIALWDGSSRGTKDMIEKATKYGLAYFVMSSHQ